MTVAEFKALIAKIPAKLDDLMVEGLAGVVLSVVADEFEAKDGSRFFRTVATVDLDVAAVEEHAGVEQDFSKLFLPDGRRNPAAFASDGRVKPGATDKAGRGSAAIDTNVGGGRP